MSSRGALDAYHQNLAIELAREPIEILRGFGYSRLRTYDQHPLGKYPVNSGFHAILDSPGEPDQHPPAAREFERRISLSQIEAAGYRAIRLEVQVRPHKQSRLEKQTGGGSISLQALIPELPR